MTKIEKGAELFKALGDVTRLRILDALFNNEMNVNEIAKTLEMNQSTISHQLRILKALNLVAVRRCGKEMFYSISDDHVRNTLEQVFTHAMHK